MNTQGTSQRAARAPDSPSPFRTPITIDTVISEAIYVNDYGRRTIGRKKPVFGSRPEWATVLGNTATLEQKAGLAFQTEVEQYVLTDLTGYSEIMVGPWIWYQDAAGKDKTASPDVLLFRKKTKQIVVLEAKLTHNARTFDQCRHYVNLLQRMFPTYTINAIEVFKKVRQHGPRPFQVSSIKPYSEKYTCYWWPYL